MEFEKNSRKLQSPGLAVLNFSVSIWFLDLDQKAPLKGMCVRAALAAQRAISRLGLRRLCQDWIKRDVIPWHKKVISTFAKVPLNGSLHWWPEIDRSCIGAGIQPPRRRVPTTRSRTYFIDIYRWFSNPCDIITPVALSRPGTFWNIWACIQPAYRLLCM